MRRKYADRANFVTLYIKEAHPLDEWQMDSNVTEGVCYPQPTTSAQRIAVANDFVKRFSYEIPLLIDPIENPANAAYAGWPERFYILDEAGTIVYKGKPGPFGYHPEEVEAWLAKRFPEAGAGAASSPSS
jgi:type I thyroxine 5'-deiodinase